jgi:predicted nucleotidyltransferase
VVGIGYFGSYARGEAGVGSDLDLVVIPEGGQEPFERRSASLDTTALPVPADLFDYTLEEWSRLEGGRFRSTLGRESVWVYERAMGA